MTHPSPQKLAHVVLRSTPENFDAMIGFYLHTLNGSIRHKAPEKIAFLSFDEEHHRIAIVALPGASPATAGGPLRTGLDHVAFTFKNLTELAQVYVSLRDHAETPLRPVWAVNHGPTTSLYYRDPERNKVEMQVDNFDTNEEADAFMGSVEFAENPFGADFDADEWSEKILSKARADGSEGLTVEESNTLKRRPAIGPRPLPPADVF
jgi:catechol-2,3-dioxygenase